MIKRLLTFGLYWLKFGVLIFVLMLQTPNNAEAQSPQQVEFYTHKIFDLKDDFEGENIKGYELVVSDWNNDGYQDAAIGLTESGKDYLLITFGDGKDFNNDQKIEVSFEIRHLKVTDINNDGNPDIIAIGLNDSGVYLFENKGTHFTSEKILDLDSQPFRIHPFDLTNDDYPELFIEYENEEFISVFKNDTTGGFEEAPNLELFSRVEGLSFADIDQDGYTDLIVANNGFTLFVNNGVGDLNYKRKVEAVTSGIKRYMATGNFNGDEYPDIVFSNGSSQLEILMNKRDFTFTEPEVYLHKYRYNVRGEIKVSDLDDNGYDDIILPSDDTDYVPENILVLFNEGEGDFVTENLRTSKGGKWNHLELADVNNDGLDDLLFLDYYAGLGAYYNRGAGEFMSAPYYSITTSGDAYEIGGIASADFNGDNHLDIAATSKAEDNVVVLENNGSGQFPYGESFDASFKPDQITSGDFNNDGHSDIAVINDFDTYFDENDRKDKFSILLNDGQGSFPEVDYLVKDGYYINYDEDLLNIQSANIIKDNPGDEVIVSSTSGGINHVTYHLGSRQDEMWVRDALTVAAFSDLNNDGDLDIVYRKDDEASYFVAVAYNESGESFSEPEFYEELEYPDGFTAADLDNNGYNDIIVYNKEGIWLMMNDGNAGRADFRSPELLIERSDEYRLRSDLEVGDFDGDGLKDILLMLHGEGKVAFYLNLGDGQFAEPVYWGVGDRPKAINIGDYNGDDRLDLAVLNDETSLDFSILINESSVPYEEEEPIEIPEEVTAEADITFGDVASPQDYRLVALPGVVDENLETLLSGEHNIDWQVYWDDGTDEDYLVEYNGSEQFAFQPGNGFWVTHQDSFAYQDTLSMVDLNDQNQATIPLHEGWNIISNPLDIDVFWEEVSSVNGDSLQPIWGFDGSFEETDKFVSARSGEAFYFLNDQGLEELTIPYVSASAKEKQIDKQQELQLVTIEKDNETSLSSIVFSRDKQKHGPDILAPPNGFEGAALRFSTDTGKQKYKRADSFARLYRKHQPEGQQFDLKLTAMPDQPVTIKAEGMDSYRIEELVILDPKTGKSFDLLSPEGVVFVPEKESTDLRLVMGESNYVDQQLSEFLPDQVTIEPNYPNPFNPTTTLQFALPEQADVRIQVYDIIGRKVSTLVNEVREAGTHTVTFDARRQASGMYFAVFEIGSHRHIQKMMLIK